MMQVPPAAMRTVAIAAVVVAAMLVFRHPLEQTMPVYLELAERLRAGPVTTSFEPLGYSWLIAVMPWSRLDASVKALHLLCFVALAVLVHVLSKRIERPLSPWLLLAFSWILFNPYVLVNLYRLNDNSLNVVAILTVFALIWQRADATRYAAWAAAGALVGALALVRPNVISLLPAVWIAAWFPAALRRPLRHATLATLAMVIAYAVSSLVITGGPVFRPANGPYNLFAGNNPSTAHALALDYNAEPSLPDGLAWCGADGAPRAMTDEIFIGCTARFMTESPIEAVRVAAFKWYNLMWRPNLRLADSPADVAVQVAQLLPSWLWWTATAVVLLRRRRLLDPIATVFVVMFGLPFVLTNSDPRFRLPLDAVYALSLASPATVGWLRHALSSGPVPSSS